MKIKPRRSESGSLAENQHQCSSGNEASK